MSNIRKALENENVSEDKIKKVLKELGIKDSKRWKPEIGEEYWTAHRYRATYYKWAGDSVDMTELLMGNVFKTKQEAQHHLYKINFLAQMKIDFEDNSDEINWNDDSQVKYSVYFDHFKNKVRTIWGGSSQNQGMLHTTNKEWLAQYIIDNEQQIKKYCFGIE